MPLSIPSRPSANIEAVTAPGEHWLLGHAAALAHDELGFYLRCERELGPAVKTRAYHVPVWVLTEPELIEDVLVRRAASFIKSTGVRSQKLVFGEGLLTSEHDRYRSQRRLIQPAFSEAGLRRHGGIAARAGGRLIARWRDGGEHDVHADLVDACLAIVTESLFSETDPEASRVVAEVARAVQDCSEAHGKLLFCPYSEHLPTEVNLELRRALARLDRYVERLVARHREAAPGDDVIDRLLRARERDGAPLDPRQIRDEIVTLLLAGHETAAAAVSWALYLLALHPACQDRVERAVAAELGGRTPDFDDVDRLYAVQQVFNETFRLYPPVYRIGRTAIEEVCLRGHRLTRGSEVILPQCAVHRSARFYAEPDAFRPERWTVEFARSLPRYAFFPFSGGPRYCLGAEFVTAQNLILLSSVLQRFGVEPVDHDVLPAQGFTLLPRGASLRLRLVPRAHAPPFDAAPPPARR